MIIALLSGAFMVFQIIAWKDREMRMTTWSNARSLSQTFDIATNIALTAQGQYLLPHNI
jgi:hypothetical protein